MNEILNSAIPRHLIGVWIRLDAQLGPDSFSQTPVLDGDGKLYLTGGVRGGVWTNTISRLNEENQTIDLLKTDNLIGSAASAFLWAPTQIGFYSNANTTTKYVYNTLNNTIGSAGTYNAAMIGRRGVGVYDDGVESFSKRRTFFFGTNIQYHLKHSDGTSQAISWSNRNHGIKSMAVYNKADKAFWVVGGMYAFNSYVPHTSRLQDNGGGISDIVHPRRELPAGYYRAGGALILIDNDTLHLIGGITYVDGVTTVTDTILEYKISTNNWTLLAKKFPVKIADCGYAQNDDVAYIVGNSASGANGEIYKYYLK